MKKTTDKWCIDMFPWHVGDTYMWYDIETATVWTMATVPATAQRRVTMTSTATGYSSFTWSHRPLFNGIRM